MGEGDSSGEALLDGHSNEVACLNCRTPLVGDFCHACGQRRHLHRTMSAFFHDLLHGVLHFEGKTWRTLPLLAWRPGELTRRYIHGERASFVSPIALFLFSVFLMFAVLSALGGSVMGLDPGEFRNSSADVRAALAEERRDLAELRKARAQLGGDQTREQAQIDREIRDTETGIKALEAFTSGTASDQSEFIGGRTGWAGFDEGLKKLNENPALAAYKVQNNAYKFSWALIPISVPFLWLLFLHRRRYRAYRAYDHTVFVTYSIAFVSFVLITISILGALGPWTTWLRIALVCALPLHMYRQLRGAYQLGRWSALWRTVLLLLFAMAALALFLLLLIALGVLG